jgi:hypothetical protein
VLFWEAVAMSVVEAICAIGCAYKYLKETYRLLKQNEDDVRDLLDEVFLYEGLLDIYAKEVMTSLDPEQSPFARAINMFHMGISGMQQLMVDYTKSSSMLKRAWTFCKQWCCTAENALKIKRIIDSMTRSVQLLNFAGNVRILQKVNQIMVSQTEIQSQFCKTLQDINTQNVRWFFHLTSKNIVL